MGALKGLQKIKWGLDRTCYLVNSVRGLRWGLIDFATYRLYLKGAYWTLLLKPTPPGGLNERPLCRQWNFCIYIYHPLSNSWPNFLALLLKCFQNCSPPQSYIKKGDYTIPPPRIYVYLAGGKAMMRSRNQSKSPVYCIQN